ncbi:putative polyketide synthase [Xylaria venustula]|nr:putative polyketide synthase [Xylaria venustula]
MAKNTVFLFGPKPSSCDWDYFSRIRSMILDVPGNEWILNVVEDLHKHWQDVRTSILGLEPTTGPDWLQFFVRWFQTGNTEQQQVSELPNVVLGPLIVIGHLAEYTQYAMQSQNDCNELDPSTLRIGPGTETVGFCIGILSAMAVACSSTWARLHHNGAAAIRLAMVIGAVVDAHEALEDSNKSISLLASWSSKQNLSTIERILEDFPSVNAAFLQSRLDAVKITNSLTQMHGRFHTELHAIKLLPLFSACQDNPGLQFPQASELVIPTYLNNGREVERGNLHEAALQAILIDHCNWYQTIELVSSRLATKENSRIISFGYEMCIPPSVIRSLSAQVFHQNHVQPDQQGTSLLKKNEVAVIGMSCNLPGAEDVEQFWSILMKGKSQHREVPNNRFTFRTPFRPTLDSEKKWYGNFIDNHDTFDHKFFGKTPREAASMDPQQRLLYQAAYQAVTQSGYFQGPATRRDKQIGCYIGVCYNDYENNVSHHTPNAFSATGNLRGFVAGKISHYFGWTGPALTIDTACSSSSVAIHQACHAILSGECQVALAGGTNFISSPTLFQNLAAASFLSPSGQSKPFDIAADGYCRGEAVAVVFLKNMAQALNDHDQILGSIASTAVSQNHNCTPIFVPNAMSLSNLYDTALKKSGISADQVSVVEAHGTGTPVGDPAEYESIRKVFGGRTRAQHLHIGSVKGLVGHTEASSGVVSLIKVILMMQERYIPPQASFSTLNPSLNHSVLDHINIATKPTVWPGETKVALINNYGASGSNASIVLKQAPHIGAISFVTRPDINMKFPFYLSGLDETALRAYVTRLSHFIKHGVTSRKYMTLKNLAFNLYRQSNWFLGSAIIFSCQSLEELEHKLTAVEHGSHLDQLTTPTPKPVILCFGGQTSSAIGLDRHVFEEVSILRFYLNKCDSVCRALGAGSIYPLIFEEVTVEGPYLQPALFSVQYACAMSWIYCGVEPVAVIGHSLGELTALCVSGALSLEEALKVIVGRAKLVDSKWGLEKGAMMAIEGDLDMIQEILIESNKTLFHATPVTIACFNAPRSYTLSGPVAAIDNLVQHITARPDNVSIRYKRLNVSHAFHSALVDPLIQELSSLGQDVSFMEPSISLEWAKESKREKPFTSEYFASHMREPVYWCDAVQRLSKKYPSAIWLEAGSRSTITTMACRAIGSTTDSVFQPVNISGHQGFEQLVDTTMRLWKAGIRATFWAHSKLDAHWYTPMILPPYQFQKHRHWLEYKSTPIHIDHCPPEQKRENNLTSLFTLQGYLDEKHLRARFHINTLTQGYRNIMSGHNIVKTASICPATLQLSIVVDAILSIQPKARKKSLNQELCNMQYQSPLCENTSQLVFIDTEYLPNKELSWNFRIFSCSPNGKSETLHLTGTVQFRDSIDPQPYPWSRSAILHEQCLRTLKCDDADFVIQGHSIYKAFAGVVDYDEVYQGVQKIVGKENQSAGLVVKDSASPGVFDAILADCFCQVGGIWANCMANDSFDDIYIASGIEKWIRAPKTCKHDKQEWHVLANHIRGSYNKSFITDIFVFESVSGKLVENIIGLTFNRVSRASMVKLLKRLTPGLTTGSKQGGDELRLFDAPASSDNLSPDVYELSSSFEQPGLLQKLKQVLAEITGILPEDISDNSYLADIGVDSLTGMEMASDIEAAFKCDLKRDELLMATNLGDLLLHIQSALGYNQKNIPEPTQTMRNREELVKTGSEANGMKHLPNMQSNGFPSLIKAQSTMILEAFRKSSSQTDDFITISGFSGYCQTVLPIHTALSVTLIIKAFKELGSDIPSAQPGQVIDRIHYAAQHHRFQFRLYEILQQNGIVECDGVNVTRTNTALSSMTSDDIFHKLLRDYPDHTYVTNLTYWTGSRLAEILSGRLKGTDLLFGNNKGRELLAGFYGNYFINKLFFEQMAQFLKDLTTNLSATGNGDTLRIMEMGAGTGGTTKWLLPVLAEAKVSVEYMFTDISASLVAAAKKRFQDYPFIKFAVHDIEAPPSSDALFNSQHIVIASNAVHATRSLAVSTTNIRKFLRPDGFLMMLEMTQTLPWVDVVFGPLPGWWSYDDGRTHATVSETQWARVLHTAGYGHVQWTGGVSPEASIQRLILATASAETGLDAVPMLPSHLNNRLLQDIGAREADTEAYIERAIKDFAIPSSSASHFPQPPKRSSCVLVTGATGSVGCHLIAHLANRSKISRVYCLNRPSNKDPVTRQMESFSSKGISLDAVLLRKLTIIETDLSKPLLGLSSDLYNEILTSVIYISHNAWPMGIKSSLGSFGAQFAIMRNLLDLAAGISAQRPTDTKVTFQFVSSIATVGYYPIHHGTPHVPEAQMTIVSVLPTGYAEAKFVCERILRHTIAAHPARFRAMTVRLGQVAGSISGHWNHTEHISFIIKSSQTLGALPDLQGSLAWTPVNDVAGSLTDLLISETSTHSVYHIDNPGRQSWKDMIAALAQTLGIPQNGIIPLDDWLEKVRELEAPAKSNPAAMILDFLSKDFERMSCGGVLLDTSNSIEHSPTLQQVEPISPESVRRYIQTWQSNGFLSS